MDKEDKSDLCGMPTEIYSRVTGYYRPTSNWNKGKQEEFKDRVTYDVTGKKSQDVKDSDRE